MKIQKINTNDLQYLKVETRNDALTGQEVFVAVDYNGIVALSGNTFGELQAHLSSNGFRIWSDDYMVYKE